MQLYNIELSKKQTLIDQLIAENERLRDLAQPVRAEARRDATVQWREVARFTATGDTTTKRFQITRPDWRVRWIAPKWINIRVKSPAEKYLVSAFSSEATRDGMGFVHARSGSFFLEITSTGEDPWQVIVEQSG